MVEVWGFGGLGLSFGCGCWGLVMGCVRASKAVQQSGQAGRQAVWLLVPGLLEVPPHARTPAAHSSRMKT